MSNITKDEYICYLTELKDSIFKILPMYEEEVSTLDIYIKSVRVEVYEVRQFTKQHKCAWMVKSQAWLNRLRRECKKEDNKYNVKSIVFGLLTAIDKQIELAKGDE